MMIAKMKASQRVTGVVVLIALAMAGCSKKEESTRGSKEAQGAAATAALPADLFAGEVPDVARSVKDVKADTTATGPVVIHGRIGGRVDPFVDGVAMFLLADRGLKACNELHGHGCPTPWDYCCEPRDSLAARLATVQVLGADGRPVPVDLRGKHGLKPMAEVTITGNIASRDGGSLVINAQKIHVARNE